MDKNIVIFDPTISDQMSKVRGIGRYLKLLKETLKNKATFTDNINSVSKDAIFINPFFNFFTPPLLSKRKFSKQIAVIHDVIPLKYKHHFPVGLRGFINLIRNKKSLLIYDLIITDSQSSKLDLINILKINEEKIKVVYPSLTESFHQNKAKKPTFINEKNDKYLIYVGDATWNKNLLNIAKAIIETKQYGIFVGKVFDINNNNLNHPWQKDLKQFLDFVKNNDHFIFPGYIKDDELVWLYKNAILNILVSHAEGFGFSYLEASSQKTPSVLSDIPLSKEVAQDNALFVNKDDVKDMAKKINTLINDVNLRNTLGEESYEHSKFFSKEVFKSSFLNALNS